MTTPVKRTPDEVLKAVQVLWPHLNSIRRPNYGDHACWDCGGTAAIEVDWPKGVTEWPRPDKEMDGTRQAKLPDDLWKDAIFRETENSKIVTGQLIGRAPSPSLVQDGWVCLLTNGTMLRYRYCFVKDEVISKTNPGKGYRLIDKDVDVPQEGDEYWEHLSETWEPRKKPFTEPFFKSDTYRRKIVTCKNGVTASPGYRLLDRGEPVTNETQVWCPTLEGWFYPASLNNLQGFGFIYQTPIK